MGRPESCNAAHAALSWRSLVSDVQIHPQMAFTHHHHMAAAQRTLFSLLLCCKLFLLYLKMTKQMLLLFYHDIDRTRNKPPITQYAHRLL